MKMIMNEDEQDMNTSLRRKKSFSVVGNISCCFNGGTQHRRRASLDGGVPFSSPVSHHHHHRRPTSGWFKSKTNDLPEIKGRCRNFISRMGRHRRHSSADFSYDPLSYSLNFNQDSPSSSDMDFNSRLPSTPPGRLANTTFDHHLPRSPIDITTSSGEEQCVRPKNDDLRRGFEALSVGMKGIKVVGNGKTNKTTSGRPEEDEEVTTTSSPVEISSNHQGILVQLC